MRNNLLLMNVGHANSLFMAITFSICAVFDLLFSDYANDQGVAGFIAGFYPG